MGSTVKKREKFRRDRVKHQKVKNAALTRQRETGKKAVQQKIAVQ
jgi:hypothetical protein